MISTAQDPGSGMEVRDLNADRDFQSRTPRPRSGGQVQADAFRRLARVFAESPETILQEVVNLAVEYCGADSSGISLEETTATGELRFRWIAIAGSFAHFLNGTTPRFFSPCGTTLNRRAPQLYRVTRAYYDYLGIQAEPITDGILIPWEAAPMRGTLWAVSHRSREVFDFQDYRLLDALADFAAIAVRHQFEQQKLHEQEKAEAYRRLVGELSHEINNPLQSVCGALSLIEHGSEHAPAYASIAAGELHRLSQLVKRFLDVSKPDAS